MVYWKLFVLIKLSILIYTTEHQINVQLKYVISVPLASDPAQTNTIGWVNVAISSNVLIAPRST